jgi:hypothetical protein
MAASSTFTSLLGSGLRALANIWLEWSSQFRVRSVASCLASQTRSSDDGTPRQLAVAPPAPTTQVSSPLASIDVRPPEGSRPG